jgi:hypothetical protein
VRVIQIFRASGVIPLSPGDLPLAIFLKAAANFSFVGGNPSSVMIQKSSKSATFGPNPPTPASDIDAGNDRHPPDRAYPSCGSRPASVHFQIHELRQRQNDKTATSPSFDIFLSPRNFLTDTRLHTEESVESTASIRYLQQS